MQIVCSWPGCDFHILVSLVARNGDSFGSTFEKLISSWSRSIISAEISSKTCADFDFATSFRLEAKLIGSWSRSNTGNIVIPLSSSNFGSRGRPVFSKLVGAWAGPIDGSALFAELLTNSASFYPGVTVFVNLILTWTWSLL